MPLSPLPEAMRSSGFDPIADEVLFHIVAAYQPGKPTGMLPPGGLADVKFKPGRHVWVQFYKPVIQSGKTTGITGSVVGLITEHIADESNILSVDMKWVNSSIGYLLSGGRFTIDDDEEIIRAGICLAHDGCVDHVAILLSDEWAAAWAKGRVEPNVLTPLPPSVRDKVTRHTFPTSGRMTVDLPANAELVAMRSQSGRTQLVARFNADATKVRRTFERMFWPKVEAAQKDGSYVTLIPTRGPGPSDDGPWTVELKAN